MLKFISGLSLGLYLVAMPLATLGTEWAIARAEGGSPIVARNYSLPADARRNALKDCNKLTPGCEIMARGKSGVCVVLATNGKGGWSYATSHRTPLAIPVAVATCEAEFPGQCEYVHSFCEQ